MEHFYWRKIHFRDLLANKVFSNLKIKTNTNRMFFYRAKCTCVETYYCEIKRNFTVLRASVTLRHQPKTQIWKGYFQCLFCVVFQLLFNEREKPSLNKQRQYRSAVLCCCSGQRHFDFPVTCCAYCELVRPYWTEMYVFFFTKVAQVNSFTAQKFF